MRNSFGHIFTLTTFGESHGEAVGGVVDGMPAGIDVDLDFIQDELNRGSQDRVVLQQEDKKATWSKYFQECLRARPQVVQSVSWSETRISILMITRMSETSSDHPMQIILTQRNTAFATIGVGDARRHAKPSRAAWVEPLPSWR